MKTIFKSILAAGLIFGSIEAFAAKDLCPKNLIFVRDEKVESQDASQKLERLLTSLDQATEKVNLLEKGLVTVVAPKTSQERKAVAELKKMKGVTVTCLVKYQTN